MTRIGIVQALFVEGRSYVKDYCKKAEMDFCNAWEQTFRICFICRVSVTATFIYTLLFSVALEQREIQVTYFAAHIQQLAARGARSTGLATG